LDNFCLIISLCQWITIGPLNPINKMEKTLVHNESWAWVRFADLGVIRIST
jgi:hypothetical protein